MQNTPEELTAIIESLTPRQKRLFMCDCAQHVLYFFTRLFPRDVRPIRALEAARQYAFGQINDKELSIAYMNADNATLEADEYVYTHRESVTEDQFINEAAGTAAQAAATCCYIDLTMEHTISLCIETIRTSIAGTANMDLIGQFYSGATLLPAHVATCTRYAAHYAPLEDQEYAWQLFLARTYPRKAFMR